MTTVIIGCGGRDYCFEARSRDFLDEQRRALHIVYVITGGASGADTGIDQWAKASGIDRAVFPANWEGRPKTEAGPFRNAEQLQYLVWKSQIMKSQPAILAFPGGSGTTNMVRQAQDAGISVYFYHDYLLQIKKKG